MKKKILNLTAVMVSVVLCFAVLSACGNDSGDGATKNEKTIAVVAKGESHAFWQSVKRGAQDAGKIVLHVFLAECVCF